MVRRRALAHAAEFALYRGVSALMLALPEPAALRLGEALGRLAGRVLRGRADVVRENLARAFPDRPGAWRRRVAGESWAHLGREGAAMLRMAALGPEDIVARTDVVGVEGFRSALAEGRGIVLVTGHLGSWEIGGAALSARGIPVVAVAKPMANRRFDAALVETRERLGMEVVDTGAAPRRVLRALAEGRVVGLVGDQNAGREGLFVPFFGHPASTHRGPALFALRSGAPVFLGVCVRVPGREARYRVTLERVAEPASGDLEADLRRLTAAHTALLEAAVRCDPEQYFWQHKRWKTPPSPEPPPGAPV